MQERGGGGYAYFGAAKTATYRGLVNKQYGRRTETFHTKVCHGTMYSTGATARSSPHYY